MIKTVQILTIGILLLVWRYDHLVAETIKTQKQLFQKTLTPQSFIAQAIIPEQISYLSSREALSDNINLQVSKLIEYSRTHKIELTRDRPKAGHSL